VNNSQPHNYCNNNNNKTKWVESGRSKADWLCGFSKGERETKLQFILEKIEEEKNAIM